MGIRVFIFALLIILNGSAVLSEIEICKRADNFKVKVFGHINRAAWLANNGHKTSLQFVDNDASSSRAAIQAEGDLTKDLKVGGIYMFEVEQNSTHFTTISHPRDKEIFFKTRKGEVYVLSQSLGEFYAGHGYMASYQSMNDSDLSNTLSTMDGEKINQEATAVPFYNKTQHQNSSGLSGTSRSLTVGDIFTSCDGLGRQPRFRYNSPYFYGFSLQSSWVFKAQEKKWDIALRYKNKWRGIQMAGVWDFARDRSVPLTGGGTTGYNQVNGSMGVLFPNGVSAMVAGAYRDWKFKQAPNANLWFTKLGYQKKFFCSGITAFAIDFGHYRNFVIDTSQGLESIRLKHKGYSVGAGVVQFFDSLKTELYFMGRFYKLKVPNSDTFKPVSVLLLGARIKF